MISKTDAELIQWAAEKIGWRYDLRRDVLQTSNGYFGSIEDEEIIDLMVFRLYRQWDQESKSMGAGFGFDDKGLSDEQVQEKEDLCVAYVTTYDDIFSMWETQESYSPNKVIRAIYDSGFLS